MKNYFKKYTAFFTINCFVLTFICVFIQRYLHINVHFVKISVANILITAFIALSWTLFKMGKGSEIVKTLLGLIALIPAVIIFKMAFGALLFKVSFSIYIFIIICAAIYLICVTIVSKKAKNEENDLNGLIRYKRDNEIHSRKD